MKKKSSVEFKVKFDFIGHYPEEKVKDLMHKIADALHHEYSHGNGFVPDDGDGEEEVMTDGVTIRTGEFALIDIYWDENGHRQTKMLDFSD